MQHFPNGAAVRIAPWSRIISDVHLLNVSPQPVTGHARLTIYTLPVADVKVKLVPFHLTFENLLIPPRVTARHTADCEVGLSFRTAVHEAVGPQGYYLLPHTHALGSRFFLQALGGALDGKSLMDVRGFNSEARGRAYDPPLDLTDADGLRFGCEHNTRATRRSTGASATRRCGEVLGFGESVRAFEARVEQLAPAPNDGSTAVISGPCANVIFSWDHNKPGGSGP